MLKSVIKNFSSKTVFLLLCSVFVASSCVTYVYPVGKWDDNWAEPVDLALHDSSLSGVVVQVVCLDKAGRDQSNQIACKNIKIMIKNLSAKVLDADGNLDLDSEFDPDRQAVAPESTNQPLSDGQSKKLIPEVVVTFREIDSSSSMCGWSMMPMLMTASMFPCIAETYSKANFSVANTKTGRSQTWPVELKFRSYNGLGALMFLLTDSSRQLSRVEYLSQLRENLAVFIRNKVYTAATLQGGL